mmetsp:Transcript_34497/g.51191  ORF Transcript_34497/g.51191 Transcript_34497/m.51191 type:complete len:144 (-) Transcript_34497:27-458(-)
MVTDVKTASSKLERGGSFVLLESWSSSVALRGKRRDQEPSSFSRIDAVDSLTYGRDDDYVPSHSVARGFVPEEGNSQLSTFLVFLCPSVFTTAFTPTIYQCLPMLIWFFIIRSYSVLSLCRYYVSHHHAFILWSGDISQYIYP